VTKVTPRPILRVEDAEGRLIWESQPERERVIDERVAFIMTDLLKDVVNAGSGYSIRDPNRGKSPVRAARSREDGHHERRDRRLVRRLYSPTSWPWRGSGSTVPGTSCPTPPVARTRPRSGPDFMRNVYFGEGGTLDMETGDTRPGPGRAIPDDWVRPDGVTTAMVDGETGRRLTEWCPPGSAREEVFLAGTEPSEICDIHAPGLFGTHLRGLPQALPGDTFRVPPDG
jgi:hypothetical protein